jgi:hypothetical protein
MMVEVRTINCEEGNTDDPFPNHPVPSFSLSTKQPRLMGLNTKAYEKLSYEEQNHRRAIHIECADKDANFIRWLINKMKTLCRFGEDKPLIVAMWGKHVLVSEVLESGKTSPGEIKNMNKMAQYHANYSTSMSQDTLNPFLKFLRVFFRLAMSCRRPFPTRTMSTTPQPNHPTPPNSRRVFSNTLVTIRLARFIVAVRLAGDIR